MKLTTMSRITPALLALAAAPALAGCAYDVEERAATEDLALAPSGAESDVALEEADADSAPDRARCIVPLYSLGWDSCFLQTQAGNPPGWLIDHAGRVDECWYHCYHSDPPLPTVEYEAYHHGLSQGITWMSCAGGQSYHAGSLGFDCIHPIQIDPAAD